MDDYTEILIATLGAPLLYLCQAMINEASVDGRDGMLAVAHVITTRSKDDRWPYEYKDIIYEPSSDPTRPKACQFSYTCDGRPDTIREQDIDAYISAIPLAVSVVYGVSDDITLGADHYVLCGVEVSWLRDMDFTVKIGSHCFYKEKERI